jgi:hypothetical protein
MWLEATGIDAARSEGREETSTSIVAASVVAVEVGEPRCMMAAV